MDLNESVLELREQLGAVSVSPERGGSTEVPLPNVGDQKECRMISGEGAQEDRLLKAVESSSSKEVPPEIIDLVLAFLHYLTLFQLRGVCKQFSTFMTRRTFVQARSELRPLDYPLSPISLFVENGALRALGLDYQAHLTGDRKAWKVLPPFTFVSPDPEHFKGFLIAGHRGLICAEVGNASEQERLLLYNPLTGKRYEIPSLNASRHPVVLSLHVNCSKKRNSQIPGFRIIAVGSAGNGTENHSSKTEVYDSAVGKWEDAGDVPGADFSINEYQTGVICERLRLLLCVGFMFDGRKGILAFDEVKRQWRENWLCPFYQPPDQNDTPTFVHFSIALLVECSGVIYLFSEQEKDKKITHCIDRLDLDGAGNYTWTRKLTRERQRIQALLVYPEFTCVPLKDHKLCIFNTIERSGIVYDMQEDPVDPDRYERLPAPPALGSKALFHSLNALTSAFEPSFVVDLPDL